MAQLKVPERHRMPRRQAIRRRPQGAIDIEESGIHGRVMHAGDMTPFLIATEKGTFCFKAEHGPERR